MSRGQSKSIQLREMTRKFYIRYHPFRVSSEFYNCSVETSVISSEQAYFLQMPPQPSSRIQEIAMSYEDGNLVRARAKGIGPKVLHKVKETLAMDIACSCEQIAF
ncbi:hypothetical protein C1H46_016581 [Malus baccata]|uniref:Uncharacterized protein n=1 Tax=Malus baccata TaxID=106549 RepID=A0A540MGG6_MALBA|nr:hypothetical protein C1H46_016581 [Malus baccata]